MRGNNNRGIFKTNTQVGLIIAFITIIILIGIGVFVWMNPTPSEDSPTTIAQIAPTEPWPDTPIPPQPTLTRTGIASATTTDTATPTSTSTPLPTATPTDTPTPTPTPTPIIIGRVSDLGYLTSVEYTLQTVVEVEREEQGFISLGRDRILLLAVGNIEAGVNLDQVQDSDIIIDGPKVTLYLPRAEITSVELLPGETEVFDAQRKWILSDYEGLEIEALDKARRQLEDWAVNRVEVLDRAETSAETKLTKFLRQLGFTEVEIIFVPENEP